MLFPSMMLYPGLYFLLPHGHQIYPTLEDIVQFHLRDLDSQPKWISIQPLEATSSIAYVFTSVRSDLVFGCVFAIKDFAAI